MEWLGVNPDFFGCSRTSRCKGWWVNGGANYIYGMLSIALQKASTDGGNCDLGGLSEKDFLKIFFFGDW